MGAKILAIGYDGGSLNVLEPLVKEGILPTFDAMIKNGIHGELESVFPPVSAPAWVSFMTGKNPGKHSVFNFTLKGYGNYYLQPALSSSIDSITLWELLSTENKRVAILNVPLTYPPRQINGIMVSGLGTPDLKHDFTYPSSFAEELLRVVPHYSIDVGWARYDDKNLTKFTEDLTHITQQTYELARYCLNKEEWDFFMVVFIGPDRIQHRMWNSLTVDDTFFETDRQDNQSTQTAKNYFTFLDSLIAKLIAECGDDTTTLILSDHGFGPFLKDIDLNNWLAKHGYLTYSAERPSKKLNLSRVGKSLIKTLGISTDHILRVVPKKVDLIKYLEQSSPAISKIDWSRTKAFCYSSNGIYVNLKGRDRFGIVSPESEYENLRSELISQLCALKDSENGRQVIKEVKRSEEIYHGHNLKKAPDLIITKYDEAGYIGTQRIFRNETNDKLFLKITDTQEGVHRMNGFLIASGKNIKKGYKIVGANIMDLLPTLLFLSNVNIPTDLDGQVLKDIFETMSKDLHFSHKNHNLETNYSLSEEEELKMLQRLKDLGYL